MPPTPAADKAARLGVPLAPCFAPPDEAPSDLLSAATGARAAPPDVPAPAPPAPPAPAADRAGRTTPDGRSTARVRRAAGPVPALPMGAPRARTPDAAGVPRAPPTAGLANAGLVPSTGDADDGPGGCGVPGVFGGSWLRRESGSSPRDTLIVVLPAIVAGNDA